MSGRRTEKKTIRGLEVETTQLPLMRSLALSARWARLATPGFGVLAPWILRAAGDKAAAAAAFSALLSDTALLERSLTALFASASIEEIQGLACASLAYTVIIHDGRRVSLDSAKELDLTIPTLKDLVAVLSFVLGVNYENFFEDAPSTSSG